MTRHIVFSLLGEDRTGLVDRLSGAVSENGGNLEESRMAALGSEFAVSMLVRVDEGRREALEAAVREVARLLDMMVLVKETTVHEDGAPKRPFRVCVSGGDHEGIVHPIVNWLASQGCSIVDLESSVSPAPHTGTMLFSMALEVEAPTALSASDIARDLARIGDRLNVDVEVEAARAVV